MFALGCQNAKMTTWPSLLARIGECQIGRACPQTLFVESVCEGTYFVLMSRPEFGVSGPLWQVGELPSQRERRQ